MIQRISKLMLTAVLTAGIISAGFAANIFAASGPGLTYSHTVSTSTALANGASPIVVKVNVMTNATPNKTPNVGLLLAATATNGATISPAGGVTDSAGNITFTVTSTNVGQSTIEVREDNGLGYTFPGLPPFTVNFVSSMPVSQPPASSPPADASAPAARSQAGAQAARAPSQQPATPASASNAASPVAPVVNEVTFNGAKVDPAKQGQLPEFSAAKSFTLSGKTTPNTELNIYVFSEPKLFKTKSDANGNWSVEVSGLPAGEHHAELEALDANGNALPRAQLGAFKVLAASVDTVSVNDAATEAAQKKNAAPLIVAVLVTVLIGVGAVILVKKRKVLSAKIRG